MLAANRMSIRYENVRESISKFPDQKFQHRKNFQQKLRFFGVAKCGNERCVLPPGDAPELDSVGLGGDFLSELFGFGAVEEADLLGVLDGRFGSHWDRKMLRRGVVGEEMNRRVGAGDIAPDAVVVLLVRFDEDESGGGGGGFE